jgi:hypothetical protein
VPGSNARIPRTKSHTTAPYSIPEVYLGAYSSQLMTTVLHESYTRTHLRFTLFPNHVFKVVGFGLTLISRGYENRFANSRFI